MLTQNLSKAKLQSFGQILPACPEDGSRVKTRMEFTAGQEITFYRSDGAVVLDYVSGMSRLAIYRDGEADVYYLDRVVMLRPGVPFSIIPMDGPCQVDVLTLADRPLHATEQISVSLLEQGNQRLQFDKIYTFLYQECANNFYFRGEKHQPYELVYVDRGELHNLVRGQDILLGQQDFMIIDSNDWHTQYSDLPVNFLIVSFWADNEKLSAVTNKRISMNSHYRDIFKKMLTRNEEDPYSGEYMESVLKILLIELLQHANTEPTPQYPTSSHWENEIVDRSIQIISENLYRKMPLEELAEAIHVSVPYLYKLFQVHLGTSPGKYIAKMRIEECKMLLRDGQLSMGQVATRMGFSSQQQFSRQFSSICGISPTQYLRSLR